MASETARIEAFSDGVFAIAVTLLILEVKIPLPGSHDLGIQLLRQWPQYVAFVLSFAFIGIMWINHHRLFNYIRRADNNLLVLNLLLLLGVTVVPFPTAVLATHLDGPEQRIAAMLYNGTYIFIAICFNFLWRYAVSRKLLGHDVDYTSADRISRQYAFGPLLYFICFIVAWWSVPVSLLINFGLALFFALPPATADRLRIRHTANS